MAPCSSGPGLHPPHCQSLYSKPGWWSCCFGLHAWLRPCVLTSSSPQATLTSQDQGPGLTTYREEPSGPLPQFVSVKWGVLSQLQWPWGLGKREPVWEAAVCLSCYVTACVVCNANAGESVYQDSLWESGPQEYPGKMSGQLPSGPCSVHMEGTFLR